MKLKIHNLEQGSQEWRDVRKLKLTASHAQAIGSASKGLETYVTEIMAEYYSSAEREQFSNRHTDRGQEIEPIAREMYELENGVTVQQVGFIQADDYVGCSPDGLVGEDGGLEIKSVDDVSHYRLIRDGIKEVESKYLWQVQMNLLVTGRKWWDLVFYNPNYKKSMVTFRIKPDSIKMQALEIGLTKGIELIKLQLN